MKYFLILGRYQPLHEGHIKLIRIVLNEGKNVLIALRDTGIDKNNPYSIKERKRMFQKEFSGEIYRGTLRVIVIPDIEGIAYGRKVGYEIREIRLDKEIEKISASNIRKKLKL